MEKPIQLGQTIPGTDLVQRFQDGAEIAPAYMGNLGHDGAVQTAMQQAFQAGYRSLFISGWQLVYLFGEWYTWSCADFSRQD